jgi:hypothetical protein
MRSQLSRDELGYLLSVYVERARKECDFLRKKLAAYEEAVPAHLCDIFFCNEPGCLSAITLINVSCDARNDCYYTGCLDMKNCGFEYDRCPDPEVYWCDKHMAGKFDIVVKPCDQHKNDKWLLSKLRCQHCRSRAQRCDCVWGPK